MSDFDKCLASAQRSLAMREHSKFQIKNKLINKGFDINTIIEVLIYIQSLRFILATSKLYSSLGSNLLYTCPRSRINCPTCFQRIAHINCLPISWIMLVIFSKAHHFWSIFRMKLNCSCRRIIVIFLIFATVRSKL